MPVVVEVAMTVAEVTMVIVVVAEDEAVVVVVVVVDTTIVVVLPTVHVQMNVDSMVIFNPIHVWNVNYSDKMIIKLPVLTLIIMIKSLLKFLVKIHLILFLSTPLILSVKICIVILNFVDTNDQHLSKNIPVLSVAPVGI
jgi:hypothetical protein